MRYANIRIIEGTGASQLGIGVVVARFVEMIGRNEGAVVPIGSFHESFGVTLSLPSRLGRERVTRVLMPTLAEDEARGLEKSAATLRHAFQSVEYRGEEDTHEGPPRLRQALRGHLSLASTSVTL